MTRSYSELRQLRTFKARYDYLRLAGRVGAITFGNDRYLNQLLYTSKRWRAVRDDVIIRDEGCDLGVKGYEIKDRIYVHHMNAISVEDILEERAIVFDKRYLICTTFRTHQAIHYGDEKLLPQLPKERRPNDMIPWR